MFHANFIHLNINNLKSNNLNRVINRPNQAKNRPSEQEIAQIILALKSPRSAWKAPQH